MRRSQLSRLTGAVVAALLAAASLSACGSSSPRSLLTSIHNGSVVLGTKYDQPGLGLRNPNKSMTGFDVEVLKYVVNSIADDQGVPHPSIKWRETPSAQRETLIDNGEVDIIAASYSINAARSKKVDFAGPYLVNRQGLLVRSEDHSVTTLTDLNAGKKLCSVSGSTSAQNVKAQLPGVQLQEFDSYSSCIEALHQKKIDALTTDEVILSGFATLYPGEFRVVDMTYPDDACIKGASGYTLKAKGSPFSTERYGIGLRKGDTASKSAVNRALTKMVDSGAWFSALSAAIGNDEAQRLVARAGGMGKFAPTPGDLSFLTSTSTSCRPTKG